MVGKIDAGGILESRHLKTQISGSTQHNREASRHMKLSMPEYHHIMALYLTWLFFFLSGSHRGSGDSVSFLFYCRSRLMVNKPFEKKKLESPTSKLLLMVQTSGVHHLRLVYHLIIYDRFFLTSQVVRRISEASTVYLLGQVLLIFFTFCFLASGFQPISGWWFQPIWKILVKMGIFPK